MVKVAYGKRTINGKGYCGRLSEQALADNVQVGDTVIAETVHGERHIHITQISKLEEEKAEQHKFIIRKHRPLPLLTIREYRQFYSERMRTQRAAKFVKKIE